MAAVISKKKAVMLPEDLIVEILRRQPVKSLLRFKCVRKTWYSIISDPEFCTKLHWKRSCVLICETSNVFSTVTIESLRNERPPIRSTPLSFPWEDSSSYQSEFLGSCNGLLCVDGVDSKEDGFILGNPSTREMRRLPPAPAVDDERAILTICHQSYVWFGYDESVHDYKIVLLYCKYYRAGIRLDVFTFKSNTWRNVDPPPMGINLPCIDIYNHKHTYIGVLSNGSIHWVVRTNDGIRILALDLASEKVRLRESPGGDQCNTWIGSLSGCLCLCIEEEEAGGSAGMDLWMMKEYGVDSSWIKLASLTSTINTSVDFGFGSLRFYPILFADEEQRDIVATFEHVCLETSNLRWHGGKAMEKMMRLKNEKGAIVSSEILLCVSNDGDNVTTNVFQAHLLRSYAVIDMEESLVSIP